ncbi:uncharacterized protein [Melanerpes formicivorus]|uniref:uncharacterized protein n=1 Tax=Melanerpes formicivorus TaxID=211600 RepID=UPI00358E4F4C
MLQTVCMSPDLLVSQNSSENELCGYSPGQGSPLPGETASPKSSFQQSPSLPDSGLTEFNVASPESCPPPSHKPQEMSAPAESGCSSDPPQKRYMGVRVKMPVRELLRRIRLSKGLEPAHGKEASLMKMVAKGSSGKAEKRRLHPYTEKQLRQNKQGIGQTLKGLEDLDILVEVLQEDLNKSQLKRESLHPVPDGFWQGFCTDLQAWRWETGGGKQAAGGQQERCHSFSKLCSWLKDFNPALQGGCCSSETPFHDDQKAMQGASSPGMFSRTSEREMSWWAPEACTSTQKDLPRNSSQSTSPYFNPLRNCPEELLEANRGSPNPEGHLKWTSISFPQQDVSAISFFQFQLHREENVLRNIPEDKLLAPDENGNRLLHKAVAQGRRALTYALAQRFAALNKIDEKDAEERTALHIAAEKNQHLMVSDLISLGANVNEQDSSGRTPLHLCAENGYLRVLEVLKNCKTNGVCVEVNLSDHCGLTPLHRAALAHTALVVESPEADLDTARGRFLRLRRDQILEGISCLLQMGGELQLQVPSSPQMAASSLKLEENTELLCLLQAHKPKGQSIQESYSLMDVPRRMSYPSSADNFSELLSISSLDL